MRFVVRVLVNALALAAADWAIDGIVIEGRDDTGRLLTLLGMAALLTLVNLLVKPVVKLLALPLYLLTLGLVAFVINALMLLLTAWLADVLALDVVVDGFWSAFLGALVITLVGFLANVVLPKKYEA